MTVHDDYLNRCAGTSDIVGHLPYLFQRASAPEVGLILELGVRSGESTCAFLAALEQKQAGVLWSVDVHSPDVPAAWENFDQWVFVRGDDMDSDVQARTPHLVDILFIDTSHRYRHTLDELTVYGPRVRQGGVILLHDVELETAPGSLDENDRGFPVRRAVNDWCRLHFLTPEFREGWHGLGVIEVT